MCKNSSRTKYFDLVDRSYFIGMMWRRERGNRERKTKGRKRKRSRREKSQTGEEREGEREGKKGNKSLLPGPSYILSKTGAHASVFTYEP